MSCLHVYAMPSIGIEPEKINDDPNNVPITEWVGKQFVMLETYLAHSMGEYDEFYFFKKDKYRGKVPLQGFSGATVTVVAVEKMPADSYTDYLVTFKEDKSGKVFYGQSYKGSFAALGYAEDIQKVKEQWLGKTIYAKERYLHTYDANTGREDHFAIKISKGEPLNVVDVLPGIDKVSPIILVVKRSNGQTGFYSMHTSLTNLPSDWWNDKVLSRSYEPFFETNPRELYPWGDDIWNNIALGLVNIGWDKDKVVMSWGNPEKKNITTTPNGVSEQWVYSDAYLYFENDKVAAIQRL